jgi:DNA-binding transcriptional LysR family regulator
MLGEARNALESAGALRQEPAGKLRISVPHGLAASIVAPLAAELVRAHARLSLEIVADDELRDLLRDELDVAVRMAAPRDSAYVMRRLGTSPVILVGSPRLDLPPARSPSELERAPWVRHTLVDGERWTFTGPHQQKETIVPVWRAAANTMDAFRSLLLAGAGIGAIPELHVIDDLRRGTLQRVCPGWVKRHVVVYGLVASRQSPPHLQLFLAALRAALRQAGLE